jgi:hypothetical protein
MFTLRLVTRLTMHNIYSASGSIISLIPGVDITDDQKYAGN